MEEGDDVEVMWLIIYIELIELIKPIFKKSITLTN